MSSTSSILEKDAHGTLSNIYNEEDGYNFKNWKLPIPFAFPKELMAKSAKDILTESSFRLRAANGGLVRTKDRIQAQLKWNEYKIYHKTYAKICDPPLGSKFVQGSSK